MPVITPRVFERTFRIYDQRFTKHDFRGEICSVCGDIIPGVGWFDQCSDFSVRCLKCYRPRTSETQREKSARLRYFRAGRRNVRIER